MSTAIPIHAMLKLPRLFHLSFVDQFVEHIKGVNQ